MTKSWKPLQIGDKVIILTPSLPNIYRRSSAEIDRQKNKLEKELGLELLLPENFYGSDYYNWINTPEERAQQIIDALTNPQIKAIFASDGGNFCEDVIEILRKKQNEIPTRNDMLLFGFSDGDQLLHFLGAELGVINPVEGPTIAKFLSNQSECEAMHDFLFSQNLPDIRLTCINQPAVLSNHLDGKLEIYKPDDRRSSYRSVIDEAYGTILLLEAGQGGRNSAASLQFSLAKLAEQQERPRAIILSEVERESFFEISSLVQNVDIPIFIGAPFGHGHTEFYPLPLHTNITIDDGLLRISAVRDLENVEEVKRIHQERKPYQSPSSANTCRVDIAQSWTERTNTTPTTFLISQPHRFYKKYEAKNLDGLNMTDQNLMLVMHRSPSHEEWQKINATRPPQTYEDFCASILIQTAGEMLMELKKTGELAKLNSVVFAISDEQIPEKFDAWLHEFSIRHSPDQNFSVIKSPRLSEIPEDSVAIVNFNLKNDSIKTTSYQIK